MMIIHTLHHFRFTFRRLRKHYLQAIGKMTWRCVCVHKQFNRGRGRSVVPPRRDIFLAIYSLIYVYLSERHNTTTQRHTHTHTHTHSHTHTHTHTHSPIHKHTALSTAQFIYSIQQ